MTQVLTPILTPTKPKTSITEMAVGGLSHILNSDASSMSKLSLLCERLPDLKGLKEALELKDTKVRIAKCCEAVKGELSNLLAPGADTPAENFEKAYALLQVIRSIAMAPSSEVKPAVGPQTMELIKMLNPDVPGIVNVDTDLNRQLFYKNGELYGTMTVVREGSRDALPVVCGKILTQTADGRRISRGRIQILENGSIGGAIFLCPLNEPSNLVRLMWKDGKLITHAKNAEGKDVQILNASDGFPCGKDGNASGFIRTEQGRFLMVDNVMVMKADNITNCSDVTTSPENRHSFDADVNGAPGTDAKRCTISWTNATDVKMEPKQ